MSNDDSTSIHWSFWIVSVVAFLWNAGGAMNYLGQMDPEMLASYPESHRAIIDGRPAWATGGFAIGVFGGVLGALMLLMRKSIAFYIFVLSLLGVIAATAHTVRIVQSHGGFTVVEIIVMTVMPVVVAAFLVWYAKMSERKTWLS